MPVVPANSREHGKNTIIKGGISDMKKALSLTLTVILALVFCLPVLFISSDNDSTSKGEPAGSMSVIGDEVSRLFPGLKEVDSSELDSSLPVIEVRNIDELCTFIDGLDSALLYKLQPVSAMRPDSSPIPTSVCDMFPGLKAIEPGMLDTSLPIIEFESSEELVEFLTGLDSSGTYK